MYSCDPYNILLAIASIYCAAYDCLPGHNVELILVNDKAIILTASSFYKPFYTSAENF